MSRPAARRSWVALLMSVMLGVVLAMGLLAGGCGDKRAVRGKPRVEPKPHTPKRSPSIAKPEDNDSAADKLRHRSHEHWHAHPHGPGPHDHHHAHPHPHMDGPNGHHHPY